jgi:hypothetical protein
MISALYMHKRVPARGVCDVVLWELHSLVYDPIAWISVTFTTIVLNWQKRADQFVCTEIGVLMLTAPKSTTDITIQLWILRSAIRSV